MIDEELDGRISEAVECVTHNNGDDDDGIDESNRSPSG